MLCRSQPRNQDRDCSDPCETHWMLERTVIRGMLLFRAMLGRPNVFPEITFFDASSLSKFQDRDLSHQAKT